MGHPSFVADSLKIHGIGPPANVTKPRGPWAWDYLSGPPDVLPVIGGHLRCPLKLVDLAIFLCPSHSETIDIAIPMHNHHMVPNIVIVKPS